MNKYLDPLIFFVMSVILKLTVAISSHAIKHHEFTAHEYHKNTTGKLLKAMAL